MLQMSVLFCEMLERNNLVCKIFVGYTKRYTIEVPHGTIPCFKPTPINEQITLNIQLRFRVFSQILSFEHPNSTVFAPEVQVRRQGRMKI